MNERKLFKNGNSLAITIPDFIVKQLELSKGQTIQLDFIDRRDGTEPFIKLQRSVKRAESEISPQNAQIDPQRGG